MSSSYALHVLVVVVVVTGMRINFRWFIHTNCSHSPTTYVSLSPSLCLNLSFCLSLYFLLCISSLSTPLPSSSVTLPVFKFILNTSLHLYFAVNFLILYKTFVGILRSPCKDFHQSKLISMHFSIYLTS